MADPSPKPSQPAVLKNDSPDTLAKVKAALVPAIGRQNIELGAGDFTRENIIPVLPVPLSPLQGRSPARPQLFELMMDSEGKCFFRDQKGYGVYPIEGDICVPLNN